jgi:hypothetical protein
MERFELLGLAEKIENDLSSTDGPSSEDVYAVLEYLWSKGVDLRPARAA